MHRAVSHVYFRMLIIENYKLAVVRTNNDDDDNDNFSISKQLTCLKNMPCVSHDRVRHLK